MNPDKDDEQEVVEAQIKKAEEAAQDFCNCKAYNFSILGVFPLDIGLWCPVKDLCGRKETSKTFRQRLSLSKLQELRLSRIFFSEL